ncbi:hypothetical protein ACI78R_11185 [Geodermatophilus sp. SYSU D01106]
MAGKLVVGALGQASVAGLLLLLAPGSPVWLLVAVTVLAGLPLGLVGLANQTAVYVQSDPARTASSAGLLRTFSYLGAIVATGAIALAFPQRAGTGGLHALAWGVLGLAGALLVLTAADRGLRHLGRDAGLGGARGHRVPAAAQSTTAPSR